MIPARGPSGAADQPPADLNAKTLPIVKIDAGAYLYRVHRSVHDPIFFGPGAGNQPSFRFDSAKSLFGVLYVASKPDAALIETLLRNPARLTVSSREIDIRSLSVLELGRDINLVDATGSGLSKIGVTAALFTGPYDVCGVWADALYSHPDHVDGLLFPSRHNPAEECIALFERPGYGLKTVETTHLNMIPRQVADLLDRHGKSIFYQPPITA